MKIQDIYGPNSPGRTDKSSSAIRETKVQKKKEQNQAAAGNKVDQVEISSEAKELQKSSSEPAVARDLLSNLPSTRAHVIYEALAKIKAGLYSSDEIAEEAAAKLLGNGELDDLIRP